MKRFSKNNSHYSLLRDQIGLPSVSHINAQAARIELGILREVQRQLDTARRRCFAMEIYFFPINGPPTNINFNAKYTSVPIMIKLHQIMLLTAAKRYCCLKNERKEEAAVR